jgi:hypothetical protein
MIAQCWLHIGTEKTGTTSIQGFLATNRDKLLKRGFLYPKSPGSTNHLGLACYGQDDGRFDGVRRALKVSTTQDVARYRARLLAELDREIAKSNASAVVFSNEHLSSRLVSRAEVLRIKNLCDRYARHTRVIVYLRNQIEFLVSRYIEAVKGGSTHPFPFPVSSGVARLMDYESLLAPWRDSFGLENLSVRRFETDDFCGGDLLADFEMQIGIPASTLDRIGRRNQALNAEAIEFLRRFNKHVPHMIAKRRNPERGKIVSLLEQLKQGNVFQPPQYVTDEVESMFRESNERVAREYFGAKYNPLFPRTKVSAGSRSRAVRPKASEMIRIAAYLWAAQQRELVVCKERQKGNRPTR